MEYIVAVSSDPSAANAARDAVLGSDPAAVVDIDERTGELRVATCLGVDELRDVLGTAGLAVAQDAIARQPSNCCGGCGG